MRSVRRPYAPLPSSALLALTLLLASSPGQGPAPEFAAVYAVASDRAKVLEQLVPGTVDYYYYHCLHAQHTGAFGAVAPLLDAWIQRHGRSKSVVEIENRQALLTFANNPEGTFDFLRQKLGLRYDAQRQVAGERSDLPTQLDQGQLSPSRLSARAVRLHPGTLDGLRDSALLSFQAAGLPAAGVGARTDRQGAAATKELGLWFAGDSRSAAEEPA